MHFLKYISILLCFYVANCSAQGFNFLNINSESGLPSNECYRIVQDNKGYIWISTEAGLTKYSSKEFTLFTKEKGMPSISDVYALDADDKGRVWFGTGGLKVGYISNDSVTVLNKIEVFHRQQVADLIYKLKYFPQSNSILVSTYTGLTKLVFQENQWQAAKLNFDDSTKDFRLLNLDNQKYLVNTVDEARDIQRSSPITLALSDTSFINFPIPPIGTFSKDCFSGSLKNGDLVVGLMNHLFIIDKNTNKVKSARTLKAFIHEVYVDNKDNVWIGCRKDGLFYFEQGNLSSKPVHVLTEISVSDIFQDMEGGIWVTSLENGVYYCSNPAIRTANPFFNTHKRVNFSKVVDDKLWLSSDDIPLAVVTGSDTVKLIHAGMEKSPHITDILKLGDSYIVTSRMETYEINKSLTQVRQLFTSKNTLLGAFGFFEEGNNKFSAFNNSMLFSVDKTGLHSKYFLPQKTTDVVYLSNDTFILAGKEALLKCVPKKPLSSKNFQIIQVSKYGKSINKIFTDASKNCWLPSNSDTLFIVDKLFNLVNFIELGIKGIDCRNVLQTGPNSFLVSSNKGIIQIAFENGTASKYKLHFFDRTNGLLSSDIFNIVAFKDKLYASTSIGLCFFEAPELAFQNNLLNTIITKCRFNDSAINLSKPFNITYTKNSFSFTVDALAFKKVLQRGYFYKYKLEGWDSHFMIATGNTITYNNLPPGNYTFIAKTFYDDGTEDTTPATFTFTIKPAFWQTWWGIAIICLIVVAMVFLFVQWRIKKIRLAEKEKATINQTIAEYRFTALKAQMDPHFIFNIVNVIQNLILEKDKTEAYNSLEKFSRLIRMVLNQSDSAFATIEEELALIDMYIGLNQLRVDHPFSFEKDIQPAAMQCQVPSLIIQPFIENAIWHGILPLKGSKPGTVSLKVSIEHENILIIEVMDNGVGRNSSELKKANVSYVSKGTKLTKERLEAYKNMNDGGFASLEIIDLQKDGVATGTLVRIQLEIMED